jgi:perosamine synthetase
MNSATAVLHLVLMILGADGGEVITTPMTFVSTNHAILYNQATPVFADIEPDTLNISADEVERLITSKTKAIVCIHYGGHPCDMDRILVIAAARHVPVLEDAAHACGARYRGQMVGGLSDVF